MQMQEHRASSQEAWAPCLLSLSAKSCVWPRGMPRSLDFHPSTTRAGAESLCPKPFWHQSADKETCDPKRMSPLYVVCFLHYVVMFAFI